MSKLGGQGPYYHRPNTFLHTFTINMFSKFKKRNGERI